MEKATFAGGCFWCIEAVFQRLNGVTSAVSGFASDNSYDGKIPLSYKDVSSGETDHAEAVQITFDPKIISFEKLLQIFFALHDPTTRNRQGADIGTQYRSVVFFQNEKQKKETEEMISSLVIEKKYKDPIVTEVTPLKEFYKAEDYHQNYYNENKMKNPYCTIVIDPKVQKLIEMYRNDIKEEYLT